MVERHGSLWWWRWRRRWRSRGRRPEVRVVDEVQTVEKEPMKKLAAATAAKPILTPKKLEQMQDEAPEEDELESAERKLGVCTREKVH